MLANLFKIFKENNYATIGVSIYLIFIIVAIFADFIAPNDPLRIHFSGSGLARNLAPSFDFYLGTTSNGRDIFSQLIHGSRMFMSQSEVTFKPEIGDFYLFPNYLMHAVYPFNGTDEERRSISFNAKIDPNIYDVYG